MNHLVKMQEELFKHNKNFPIKMFEYTILAEILVAETELGEAK